MDKKYTVLKKFGEYKKGDVFDPIADEYDGTEADIASAIEGKFIAEITDTNAQKSKKGTSATVTWNGGTREFSLEVHGEDFMSLAESFATKFKGTIA